MIVQNSTPQGLPYRFNWDDARIFLAAYRRGSLMGAGEALGISHSTVRRRLAGLEAALGVTLFTPTADGLVPTDAAKTAFDVAESIETATTHFSDSLTGDARDLHGSLIITTVDGLADIIAPSVARYAAQHPKVAITLNTENRHLDLARREADIAIRLTDHPDDRLFGRKVANIPYAPFASKDLIKQYGRDVAALPWILWDEAAGAIGSERWYAERSGNREPIARVTNAMTLLSLARASVGGAILALPLAKSSGLVPLEAPIEGFDTALWCLCRDDLRHSDRVRAFMDQLAKDMAFL